MPAPQPAQIALACAAMTLCGSLIGGCKGDKTRYVTAAPVTSGTPAPDGPLGETATILVHLDQAAIDRGDHSLDALFARGQHLFDTVFNELDGQGRPQSTGGGAARAGGQPAFIRTSGPDSSSCADCHSQPRSGGAGGFVANVFVLAQTLDPVTTSVDAAFSNERNTPGMFGAGAIELLAREMTTELQAIRTAARTAAQTGGQPVTRDLVAKGVSFGQITVQPDGRVDPTAIDGVDWDLVIKPFHQKGAVISLREFTNNAMNHHHGMQSQERFGVNADPDADGVQNELSVGDITAVTLYQAALPVPGRSWPSNARRRAAAERGEVVFAQIGCTDCHVAELTLNSAAFSEPNPFNPAGNLLVSAVGTPFSFDLTSQGPTPRLESRGGGAVVRAFTDLKRHDLNDATYAHFANEQLTQGTLAGGDPASSFTVAVQPRPTREFLTRKLWDAGNSAPYGHRGDLTTLTRAIHFHGGDARTQRDAYFARGADDQAAVIEFLKTLQVLPEGSGPEVVDFNR